MLRRNFLAIGLLLAAFLVEPALAGDSGDIEDAKAAATRWLALTDSGQYAASWKEGAGLFKAAIAERDWVDALRKVRAPMGALAGRKVLAATFTHKLPGAPDGDYVVIHYSARFENKSDALETVTPVRDRDGTWRVSGYYVQ